MPSGTLVTFEEIIVSLEILDEGNAQAVAMVGGRSVTRGELSKAFDRVRDRRHWKYPVDATIKVANDSEIVLIEEAIVFFTGSVPKSTKICKGLWHTRAVGYFIAIGA